MKLLTCDNDNFPRSWAPLRRKILAIWFVATLPLAVIFLASRPVRLVMSHVVSSAASSIVPVQHIFCGDRYTREGGDWGWRLSANPLGTLNVATDTVTTWQIDRQVDAAFKYRPDVFFMSVGADDFSNPDFDAAKTVARLAALSEKIGEKGARLILTLVPFGADPEKNKAIADLNEQIVKGLPDVTTLNLNNVIAPRGVILPIYVTDEGGLSPRAYGQWGNLIKSSLATGDVYRPAPGTSKKR